MKQNLPEQRSIQERASNRLGALLVVIKAAQEAKGLSNRDLAKLMGVSHPRITQMYQADHSLSLLNMERLADALGLDLEINFYYPRLSDDGPDRQSEREEYRREAAQL